MASDLKKVGLVFNADGSADFIKSLKNVNASLQENYADFKLVQAQYDKNTSSSQKLVDKLNYLNNAYDIQKNKVRVLQEELDNMVNAENKDEVAITKKQTALKQAETQLEKYSSQIKSVSKEIELGTADLKDYAKNVDEIGKKITDAGKKASILSAGIAASGTVAISTSMNIEEAINRYLTSTGKSTTETERFKNILKNIHDGNYGSDYSDIANKMALVTQQLGDISDTDFQNIVENAYLLEDAFGIDFNEAIRGVSGLIKNMGLSADEAFNYIVVGAQNGLNKSNELGDNLAEYTQLWGQAGFSAEEMFTILQNGLNSGAYNLDKVNDFVKEFTISLSDGRIEENLGSFSKETRKLFNEFQKGKATAKDVFYSVISDLEGMENKQQALTLASNTWSALGEDNAMSIITSLNDVSNTYKDVSNSANQAQDTMYSGTKAKAESMKKKIQSSFSSIGDTLISNILPVLEKMSNGLQNFIDWFDGLDQGTKNTIITIGLLIAAIGPLLIMFGSMAGAVSNIITLLTNENTILALNAVKKGTVTVATKAWQLAQVGLNGVLAIGKVAISGVSTALSFLAANPIVLIIAAIAALVAGLIYLWNTNDNFRNAIINAWTFIQNLFVQFDQFLTAIFSTDWANSFGILGEYLNVFLANVSNFYNAIKQIFQGIIDFVKGVFTGDWSLAWQGIQNIFGGIFNGLLAIAKAPLNGIIGFLNILISGINLLIKGLNKIKFDVPDWVPGIGGKKLGFSIKQIGKIPYMADGGTLLQGAAIVAEAGPELLLQQGSKTKVIPLNNKSNNTNVEMDSNQNQRPVFQPNITINSNSKYLSEAETARQTRIEMQRLLLKWKRG